MNDDDVRRAIHDALGDESHPVSLVDRVRAGIGGSGRRFLPAANWFTAAAVAAMLVVVVGGTTLAVRSHRSSPQQPAIGGVLVTPTPAGTATPSAIAQSSASAPASANPTSTPQPTSTNRPTATPHPSATPTPTPTAPPACSSSDLSITTATDASSYAPGAPVRITTQLRNTSSHACTAPSGGCGPEVVVDNSGGNYVWSSRPPGTAACLVEVETTFAAGQTSSFEATWQQCTWQQGTCSGQVAPGTYSARGIWPAGNATPVSFSIS